MTNMLLLCGKPVLAGRASTIWSSLCQLATGAHGAQVHLLMPMLLASSARLAFFATTPSAAITVQPSSHALSPSLQLMFKFTDRPLPGGCAGDHR